MAITVLQGVKNAPLEPLKGKTVAMLGFGNQGQAHALNLRESGIRVVVGTRSKSASGHRASSDGFEVLSIEEATAGGDLVILALPDEVQSRVFQDSITKRLRPGITIGFIHGFNIRFGLIKPPA